MTKGSWVLIKQPPILFRDRLLLCNAKGIAGISGKAKIVIIRSSTLEWLGLEVLILGEGRT